MAHLTVSVVVPSLNRGAVIRQALDSILAQDYTAIECIVMDGGSSDGTLDILRSYGDQIRWVSEADQGQADAIDRGLRRSRGQICGWLNADDIWWEPSVVSKVVAAFESDEAADVIYGDCASIAADGSHIGKSYVVPDWTLRYSVEHADHCIAQPASFIRRRALERVGFLDRSKIFMDWDLWLRIGLGGKIKHVPICMAAARDGEHHWYRRHAEAAAEWVATLARAIDDPRMPEDIRCHRNKALSHAYMRGMRYCWAGGRRLGQTFRFGMNAARYDWRIMPEVLSTAKQFADEAARPRAAAFFSALNQLCLMAQRAGARAQRISRRLKLQ
jgi:hypothetical protein